MSSDPFLIWMAGLRSKVMPTPSVEREAGQWDFYHPVLDRMGKKVGCARLYGERDEAYRSRLVVHIGRQQQNLDALMQRVLSSKR